MTFRWTVHTSGYRWVPARGTRPADAPRLSADRVRLAPQQDTPTRTYEPLIEEEGLFRTFAETPPTRDGLAAFAARFGPLSADASEDFDQWCAAVHDMRNVVDQLDFLSEGVGNERRERARWRLMLPPERIAQIARAARNGRRLRRATTASVLMRDLVHSDVEARVAATLSEHLTNRVQTRVVVTASRERDLIEVPTSLLGAMWLQAALAFVHRSAFVRCRVCETRWIQLGITTVMGRRVGKRADARVCSNACWQRDEQRRRQLVKDLAASGRTPRQVHAELVAAGDVFTSFASVERWMAAANRGTPRRRARR